MLRMNHKTQKIRMIHDGKTLARVDETEAGHTGAGRILRGYSYKEDGRRVLEASIPAPQVRA